MQQLFSALPLQFKQLTDCLNVLYKIIRFTGIFKVCNYICAICAAQINARKIEFVYQIPNYRYVQISTE